MKIYNPSNKAITDVRIFGTLWSIDAEGTLENVPEETARYWQSLHSFLQIKKDKLEDKKVETIEVPAPKVAEVLESTPEEITPEVVEEPTVPSPTEVLEAPVVDLKNEVKKGRPKKVK